MGTDNEKATSKKTYTQPPREPKSSNRTSCILILLTLHRVLETQEGIPEDFLEVPRTGVQLGLKSESRESLRSVDHCAKFSLVQHVVALLGTA